MTNSTYFLRHQETKRAILGITRLIIKSHTKLLALFLYLTLLGCQEPSSSNRTYVLTTGTTSATYYPVGVALATLVSADQDSAFSLSAISSAGSLENVKLLRDNQAQLATMLSIFATWAYEGEGPILNPQSHLRAVTALWPNVEHLLLKSELVTDGTFSDFGKLNGGRISIGMRNSGAEITGLYMLDKLGIDYKTDLSIAYLGYGPSADALQDDNIVGLNAPGGPPMAAITRAHALLGDQLTILSVNQEELNAINSEYLIWNFYDLPANTYPSQNETIRTAGSANVLIAREDVPDSVVYALTKLIWENLAVLREIHGATRSMVFEQALRGVTIPLHDGARRFYQEKGLDITEALLRD